MNTYKEIFSLNENSLMIKNLKTGLFRELTLNQFRLLECLIQGKGKKNEIIEYVWLSNNIVVSDGSYHQLVFQTRAIFEAIGLSGEMIKTFPRYGLKLVDDPQDTLPPEVCDFSTEKNVTSQPGVTLPGQNSSSGLIARDDGGILTATENDNEQKSIEENVVSQHNLVDVLDKKESHNVIVSLTQGALPGSSSDKSGKDFRRKFIVFSSFVFFFLGGAVLACSIMSSSFGFFIFHYLTHPPLVYSEKNIRIYSDSMSNNDVRQSIEFIDAYNPNIMKGKYPGEERYGVMDDFYIYKSLIMCSPKKEINAMLSLIAGASCENYVISY